MNPKKRLTIAITVIISTLIMACQCQLPSIFRTPTPAPTFTPTPPPEPLPPQVIQVMPARGEEQPLDAPIQLVFDQPMDRESVQTAFTIEPAVGGDLRWVSPRVVQFRPAGKGFERATRYTVTIEENARSAEDLPLNAPVQFHFATVGFLEVAAVQPADGTPEVATDAIVTVLFNRPVVPLTAIEDQDNLPQPLTFVPPVRGSGEWLNTSIYRFIPDEDAALEPATTYKARIAAGLTDTTGGVLADDFAWEFTTVMPAVVATYPDADTIYVSPEPAIHVAFNQLMDRASAEAAFELKNRATDEVIAGTFEWHDRGLVLPDRRIYEPYQWSWSAGKGPERVGVRASPPARRGPRHRPARSDNTVGPSARSRFPASSAPIPPTATSRPTPGAGCRSSSPARWTPSRWKKNCPSALPSRRRTSTATGGTATPSSRSPSPSNPTPTTR
jgi:hypothetical protein